MQLDFVNRELTIKLVYYGPALSGKTTNLQALHKAAAPGASGRLMTPVGSSVRGGVERNPPTISGSFGARAN